jgi:hypothetical protein
VCAHGSSVHQKYSNYALTNLLFSLCKSVWIIDPLVTCPNPHPEAPTRPSTFKVLELGSVSPFLLPLFSPLDWHLSLMRSFGVHQSHLVLMCHAHGYRKFGNFPTLIYITLCHYMWRLLASNSQVWTRKLCLSIANNTSYIGCDCRMCYSTCVKGFTFRSVVVGRLKWLNMERPCALLCTMSSSQCGWVDWPILNCGSY